LLDFIACPICTASLPNKQAGIIRSLLAQGVKYSDSSAVQTGAAGQPCVLAGRRRGAALSEWVSLSSSANSVSMLNPARNATPKGIEEICVALVPTPGTENHGCKIPGHRSCRSA